MTAGIRFPQNNPGTKKWIVSLIFSKTSTSPQQLNDRHMSSFPFSHSALPAHRLNTVSTLTTLTCGGWVSGEFGPNSPTDNQANQVSPLTGGKTKQNDPIREMRRCFHGCSKMPTANLSKLNCSAAENVKSTWGLELGQFLSGRVKAWGWWILKKNQKKNQKSNWVSVGKHKWSFRSLESSLCYVNLAFILYYSWLISSFFMHIFELIDWTMFLCGLVWLDQ